MQYLFFDIECANCFDGTGKICEFGYVLTDDRLNTLSHGIFLIHPNAEFQDYVIWKIISYKVEDYLRAPQYPEVYHAHIGSLLGLPDTVYVGHGVRDDVKYLNDEAKRYSLPSFSRTAVDSCMIHKKFYRLPKNKGLEAIVKELALGDPKKLHNSEYDAQMTLAYVRVMCQESGLSFAELIETYDGRKIVKNAPLAPLKKGT